MYMEMWQENSLSRYIEQTKMSLFFLFTKLEDRRAELVLSVGVGTSRREEVVEKGYRRMNIVQIL
jgi:hypothetical protein